MNYIWNLLLNIFRDPATGSLATIIIPFLTWLGVKVVKKKLILYTVLSKDELLNITNEEVKQHIQVIYRNSNQSDVIENLYLFKIRFFNAGNVETRIDDFNAPITVEFGEGARILGVNIIERCPRNLQITPNWASTGLEQLSRLFDGQPVLLDKIEIPPVALNPKDSFLISALVTQPKTTIVSGRVLGGKFKEKRNDNSENIKINILFFVAMIIYMIGEFFPSIRSAISLILYWLMFITWMLVILGWADVIW
jgi:hypothetical protein